MSHPDGAELPMLTTAERTRVAFGVYEADLNSGELWKSGHRVHLQSQPFKILVALIERPGEIVTRQELQARLWGEDTVVGFEHSLGTAVNRIREALGDTASNPRFIETLNRRGYRFIAPVVDVSPPASPATSSLPDPLPADNFLSPDGRSTGPVRRGADARMLRWSAALLLLSLSATAYVAVVA